MRDLPVSIIVTFILILSIGCGNQATTRQPEENGSEDQAASAASSNDPEATTPENESTSPQIGDPATFGADIQTDLPDGWWEDVPLMVGFEIDTFRKQGDGMMAICRGNLDIDIVTGFYSNLEGWEVDEDPTLPWITEGNSRRLTYIRDEWNLLIRLNLQEDDTLNLTILLID